MIGRRLPAGTVDPPPIAEEDLQAGDYWRVLDPQTSAPVEPAHWMGVAATPEGGPPLVANLLSYTVEEHENGSISVLDEDGSLALLSVFRTPEETWSGYVDHGDWRADS